MKSILVDGIKLCPVSLENMAETLIRLVDQRDQNSILPRLVTYLNAYNFNLTQQDKNFHELLEDFDLIYADGYGMVVAAKVFGQSLPGRLTAYDFFFDFCSLCEKQGKSIYLLGGEKGVAKLTSEVLRNKFPGLKIKGCHHGYLSKDEEAKIFAEINDAELDFLIVNMGAPTQEVWLTRNIDKLNVKVGWCVGGLFNYISGKTPRCPYWLGKIGLEWLFRLCVEPKRLWKRYVFGIPFFCYYLLKLKWKNVKKS